MCTSSHVSANSLASFTNTKAKIDHVRDHRQFFYFDIHVVV